MDLEGIFKCCDCGATGTRLVSLDDMRMVCADHETCLMIIFMEHD
jgi:hypothetical protein